MSQFPQIILNASNSENGQLNVQQMDLNMFQKCFENNPNMFAQNLNTNNDNSFFQQKMPNQYVFQVPSNYMSMPQQYVQMISVPGGNPFCFNQQPQFISGDGNAQYTMPQIVPVQLSNAPLQVEVSDLNKANLQNNNSRSRKKSYNNQIKQESGILNDPNEPVPCDTRNRPLSYSCPECSRKFSLQSRLSQHIRCHNGNRPYQCKECQFAFTQKSYLVRHAAVHKEERPYECALCKKTYKHYGSLANHRKTHKNDGKMKERSSEGDPNGTNSKSEVEIIDVNNNNANSSYLSTSDTSYFQNGQQFQQQLQQQIDPQIFMASNLFPTQYTNIPNNIPNDPNNTYLNQLANNLGMCYSSLMAANANSDAPCDVKSEMVTLDQTNSDPSISIESSSQPPASQTQSSPNDLSIQTFTV